MNLSSCGHQHRWSNHGRAGTQQSANHCKVLSLRNKSANIEACGARRTHVIATFSGSEHDPWLSSHPGELPPEVLPEPYVTLSRHTAPIIHSPQHQHLASGQTGLIAG